MTLNACTYLLSQIYGDHVSCMLKHNVMGVKFSDGAVGNILNSAVATNEPTEIFSGFAVRNQSIQAGFQR